MGEKGPEMRADARWMCRSCGHVNMEKDGPVCENCEADNSMPADSEGAAVSADRDEIEAVARLLLARSGGHFEAIRDMSEEKARADAKAVISLLDAVRAERAGDKPLMPVPERERDMDIYAAEQRARRELLDEIVDVLYDRARAESRNGFAEGGAAIAEAADEVLARFGHDGK